MGVEKRRKDSEETKIKDMDIKKEEIKTGKVIKKG